MTNEQLEVTDEWLDRLVDGELCEEEYRRVLTALDAQPDGWRRCAAAFLEAQAWGRELRVVRHELVATPGAALATSNPRAKAAWLPLILAIAASFLVAFGLGIWWRGERVPRDVPLESIATAPEKEAAASSANLEAQLVPARPAPGESVPEEVVTLVVDRGDGAQEQFSLPVYDANDTIARQWLDQRLSLPSQLEQRLRRSGYEVQVQREWTPLDLRDGRRVLFPVDQWEITPVKEIVLQ